MTLPPAPSDFPETLDGLFRLAVKKYPRRTALECAGKTWSYEDAEACIRAWATRLRRLGAAPGKRVAIFLPRSAEHVLAIVAVLRTGASYVPLDSSVPLPRAKAIAADAGVACWVTNAQRCEALGGLSNAFLVDGKTAANPSGPTPPETAIGGGDEAYVIYTSGSTGAPKGVPITHGNAMAFVRGEAAVFPLEPQDRVYHGFSIAFDASVEEIWLAFRSGATLVVADEGMATAGSALPPLLTHARITVLSVVPTLLSMFEEDIPTVRLLITGGEACPEPLVARWAPKRRMVNTYGPTETTVVATWSELKVGQPIRIGRELPGYLTAVVDENRLPLAAMAEGELLIGGPAVSRGYLARPELNARKFIEAPALGPGVFYCTGDRVRLEPDGALSFLGRVDDQVKLRGFRIELGEIEAALSKAPGVARAAVMKREEEAGLPYLAAYVVETARGGFDEKSTREALRAALPAYMVPAVFVRLAAFPVTSGGKVDKARLPAPDRNTGASGARGQARTGTEGRLLELWGRYFAPQIVEPGDDFFDLGGHSLLATRLVSDLRAEGVHDHISVTDIYEHRTLEALAKALDARRGADAAKPKSSARSFLPVSRVKHFLCGLAQLISFHPIMTIASAGTLLGFFVYQDLFEKKQQVTVTALLLIALILAIRPVQMALGLAVKWIVIGRFREGSWPLWSAYYFRFWIVRQLLTAFNFHAFKSTPTLNLYYRLLGARIGKGVHLQTVDLLAADLIALGEGAIIGKDAGLSGYVVEGGRLHIGPIAVGRHAVIGAKAVLCPGSSVGDGAQLEDGALLRSGERIAGGERWAGCPAKRVGKTLQPEWAHEKLPKETPALLLWLGYVAGALALPLFPLLAALPGTLLMRQVEYNYADFYGKYWDFWKIAATAPVSVALFVVCLCLQIAAAKWILLGRQTAGIYPLRSMRQVRQWFVDSLLHLSHDLLFPLYATIYLPSWFRLMGARLGKRVEVSTAEHINPDLLELHEGSFVADAVCLGAAEVRGGWVRLAPVAVGRNSFLGNSALVPGGTVMGDETLVGVLSMPPPEGEKRLEAHASWLGIPSFRLPRRQETTPFREELTYKPSRKLILQRALIEGIRVILPGSVMVTLAMALLLTGGHLLDEEILETWQLVLVYPFLAGLMGLMAMAFTIALKWAVMGRYVPREKPLWDPFVWKSELVTATHEHLAIPALGDLMLGTPFLPWYFRLLGSRVGKRVFLDSFYITEFDLVDLGDECAVNHTADCQTHLFEDRVMKMDFVRLERRASIGPYAVVLYGGSVGEGSFLDARSLVMKGETLPPGTKWAGSPAQRMGDA